MVSRRVGGAVLVAVTVFVALCVPMLLDEDSPPSDGDSSATPVTAESATLAWVTDGDTLKVDLDGGVRTSVRLIGIDTPETYAGPECGGDEATTAMQRLVRPGDRLELQIDPTQDEADRYGRLLRYVLADGKDLGREQLASGAASVYVYDRMFAKAADYRRAESSAKAVPRGIWKNC